jgi:hypothetical protein
MSDKMRNISDVLRQKVFTVALHGGLRKVDDR